MKVAELVAAFQRFATTQNNAESAGPDSLPDVRPPSPAAVEPAAKPVSETEDQISVSPEAIFTFAASRFDPERITRDEVRSLADTLRDGGAISVRDRAILASTPQGRLQTAFFEHDPGTPTNLINEFQGRLAVDMANSDINAVEEDTRALAILGRLSGIREELNP